MVLCRGRDAGFPAPPRTDPDVRVNASGSYLGYLTAKACRIHPAAWLTLSRRCVRRVLSLRGFPLVEALPSTNSAGTCTPCSPASTVIFPRPTSSLRSSQASVLLPFAAPARLPVRSEDLPGPDGGRTDVHGVSDAAKLPCTSPSRGAGDVAFDELDRLGASDYLTFGAQYPCPHAPLPTLQPQPHGQRCTARGETRSATPFVSRDSHPLPFTSSPGAPS